MQQIDFRKTTITDGFWKKRIDINSNVSIFNVYKRFAETGRFDALNCCWKPGDDKEPHIFWDSDIAKWVESAAYILEKEENKELEDIIDNIADVMEKNADDCGYFNSCYLVHEKSRWSDRTDHELYCLGHFIEAAVAYFRATEKDKLLNVIKKYLDYVYNVFIENNSATFKTPGHEEIELALVKLYELTYDEKYLDMCKFFINTRGTQDECEYNGVAHKYSQSHLPVREQFTAEGHSVRACYLYSGMADLARLTDDKELFDACDKIFDDIATKKMYITGGIGSSNRGEAFTIPYDLPDLTAYSESCAALSLAWFAHRMLLLKNDSKYADVVERVLYNNALSSVTLDGKAFFYVNPLAVRTHLLNRHTSQSNTRDNLPITQRLEVFDCSCCPPNITRFMASIADFIYTKSEDTLFIHQFIDSETTLDGIRVSQKTGYPNEGKIIFKISGVENTAIRIPSWCDNFSCKLNGKEMNCKIIDGYIYFKNLIGENEIELSLDMNPFVVYPTSKIKDTLSRCAVQRGPIVYCAEGVHNNFDIMSFKLNIDSEISQEYSEKYSAYVLFANGTIPNANEELYSRKRENRDNVKIKLIPYFAFANEQESDMEVFFFY